MDTSEQINDILIRLKKLEEVVFSKKQGQMTNAAPHSFTGAKGGVLLLISKDYFEQVRSAPDVRIEIGQNGYHYSIQVIQTALNRLSKEKGPLVAMRDGGKKVYVKRK